MHHLQLSSYDIRKWLCALGQAQNLRHVCLSEWNMSPWWILKQPESWTSILVLSRSLSLWGQYFLVSLKVKCLNVYKMKIRHTQAHAEIHSWKWAKKWSKIISMCNYWYFKPIHHYIMMLYSSIGTQVFAECSNVNIWWRFLWREKHC